MTDLRFPLGPEPRPLHLSAEEREEARAAIRTLPAELRAAVAGLDAGQLDTPYRDGGWTVRQVVHHVADSHLNAYVRFKLALTEDHPTVKPYREERWAELPDSLLDPDVSLRLLDAVHARLSTLLAAPDLDWSRPWAHPTLGRNLTLDTLLGIYAWHGRHHVAHITRLRQRQGW